MKKYLLSAATLCWLSLQTPVLFAASLDVANEAFTAKDYSKVFQHAEPLAKQGNPEALYLLGQLYENGWGVNADLEKAKSYYQNATIQGHPQALTALRSLKNQEYLEELKQVQPQAEAGDAKAQNRLGKMYEFGQGVERDPAKALHWYTQAANQGYAEGLLNLGRCYNLALGVGQNFAKAEEYYRQAAGKGLDEAMFWLGSLYFNKHGQDSSEDTDVIGYAWLKNAANKGHAIAIKMISRLELKLDTDQLTRAQVLAEKLHTQLHPAQ
ncbi:tetratricopeptide repeat protein [Balneatrix alpica]|uniref:Tetratricopeptide repeat protein n=1 Tax=Balneatrix alpica TaxID=75684 RepID=A0ABV5ZBX8_9GAMM|nr:tetratricopeptide repeat protein [Balneatrix alpica]